MKWIKYEYVCGTDTDGAEILAKKRVGYSEANIVIAQTEAYNGEYTIEDDGKDFSNVSKFIDDVDMQGHKVTNLGEATEEGDAVPYGQVDEILNAFKDGVVDEIKYDVDYQQEIAAVVPYVSVPKDPTFVSGTSEMTDKSKVYVNTETGTLWQYKEVEVVKETTVTDNIVATTDNPYIEGSRLSSSGDGFSNDAAGYLLTPLIDFTKEEYVGKEIELHLEGLQYITQSWVQWIQNRGYAYDKSVLWSRMYSSTDDDAGISGIAGLKNAVTTINSATNAVIKFTPPLQYSSTYAQVGYMRFCAQGAKANSKIYITYKKYETVTETRWTDTGIKYAPVMTEADMQTAVNEIISRIDTELLSVIGTGEVV